MQLPFGISYTKGNARDIYELMMNQPIGFDEDIDASLRQLLTKVRITSSRAYIAGITCLQMLERDPSRRATLAEVKNHPWFSTVYVNF